MAWLILALGAAAVIAIAGYAVRRTAARLSHTEAVAVYDLAAAVDWVVDRLPESVAGELTEADVSDLLLWQIEALRRRGVATFGLVDEVSAQAQQTAEVESAGLVLVEEDDLVVEVLQRAWNEGREISEVAVVVVLDIHNGFLSAIEAIGEQAE